MMKKVPRQKPTQKKVTQMQIGLETLKKIIVINEDKYMC